ncbi:MULTISPECIES: WecB/TagA/CpsF family glycosyltransferase [unclassified Limnobacter]|uniref:WecB/TagA/CpsF family glycosyltransferase n=2 Tax=Limnobacter TaxID=131079 RepID=UPI0025BF6B9A|nr:MULTISPECIES: WecB/TagA/CpsF family glycosyltransferase [unclassified Limnobacter]|tara:strand:- start:27239 stop:28018 length:780 start_codon:yes stop_codon:yes gene_type:complete
MKVNLLGYNLDGESINDCVHSIFHSIQMRNDKHKKCEWLACLNPHSYVMALEDQLFNQSLHDADWLIPDGAGVVLASRILGNQINERVTGSDVFYGLHSLMNTAGGLSVFFLGASESTLQVILERMKKDYPNIRVAGTYSPPFKPNYTPAEQNEMIELINTSAADVLWVGMTAPKQEKWINECQSRLEVKFAAAIGAVFDFYAGKVKRSHPAFQRLGLEWLPRLIQEPRRLWRRMFISAPIFLWHVVKAKSFDSRKNVL